MALRVRPSRWTRHAERGRFNIVGPVLLGLDRRRAARAHQALAAAAGAGAAGAPSGAVPSSSTSGARRSPVFTHTANSIAANVAAFGGGRGVPRRRDLPAAPAPGRASTTGVRVVGIALLLCTLGWTTGSMSAARAGRGPRNQIAAGHGADGRGATFVMAIPAGGAVLPIARLRALGPRDGHREPGALRGGAGRRRRGPRGPVDVEHPAGPPGGLGDGRGRRRHRLRGDADVSTGHARPSAPARTCPPSSTPPG